MVIKVIGMSYAGYIKMEMENDTHLRNVVFLKYL